MKIGSLIVAALVLGETFRCGAGDVSRFFLVKSQEYFQTNATTLVSVATNKPFHFRAEVEAVADNSLLSALLKLPNLQTRTLTNRGDFFEFEVASSNKAALDTVYGPGTYSFLIFGQNTGTNRSTLALPSDKYPPLPVIANWNDLQAVENAFPVEIVWGAFTNGTVNDQVYLEITDSLGRVVASTAALLTSGALNATNLSAQLPSGTLGANASYVGRLLFLKRTGLSTNISGAIGVSGYSRETTFPINTLPSAPASGRIQFSSSNFSARENDAAVNLFLVRSGTSGHVTVDLQRAADANGNGLSLLQSIHFADGQSTVTVTLPNPVADNFSLDGTKLLHYWLTNPQGGAALGNRTHAVLSVLDDEITAAGALSFSSASYSVAETGKSVAIAVTRTGGTAGTVTVDFATQNGLALAGQNYLATNGTLVFGPGAISKFIVVPVMNDSLFQSQNNFLVNLSNPTPGASLGIAQANVSILNDDLPGTIGFKQSSFVTNESAGNFFVTVLRSGGTASGVTVDYATHDGTGAAWQRYVPATGTLTFGSNELSKIIPVQIINNSTPDADQTFTMELSNATGGAVIGTNKSVANFTVLDDESSVSFSNAAFTVSENVGKITATVIRTGSLRTQTSVNFSTANLSAITGQDYRATNGTLIFPPNTRSKTFSVNVLDNSVVDGNRAFQLQLSNPTNGVELGLQNTATVTITNNDAAGIVEFGNYKFEVAENGKNASINIVRHDGLASGVTVNFSTSDGDAVAGVNYSNVSQTVTFGAGETTKQILVPVKDNADVDGDRTVLLALRDPAGGAELGDYRDVPLTIVDDDRAGAFSFARANYSVRENGGSFLVNVIRTGGKGGNVTVDYFTEDDTATAEADYVATNGTLWFGAGETNKTISVAVVDDALSEGVENFRLRLTNPSSGGTLGVNDSTRLTILDDERSFSISNTVVSVSEAAGSALITVLCTGTLTNSVTVKFAMTNLTATPGADYASTNGTLTFSPTVATRTIAIPIVNDGAIEGNEAFNVYLFNPTGGVPLGQATNALVTIVDDDFAGSVQFATNNYYGTEGSNAVITLVRTGGLAGGVSVHLLMNERTAVPGLDFGNKSGFITFAPGQSATNISVPILTDPQTETNETADLILDASTGGLAIGAQRNATLTIRDRQDPASIPEAGPVFFSVAVNGTNVTGLTLSDTNYVDLSAFGLNSALSFKATRLDTAGIYTGFEFIGLAANGQEIISLPPHSSANGVIKFDRNNTLVAGQPEIHADSYNGDPTGTVTIDVLNKTTRTVTGRFDFYLADVLAGKMYHVTGSFRVRW